MLFTLLLGSLGVTAKLALDDMPWTGLFLWQVVTYAVAGGGILLVGRVRPAAVSRSALGYVSGALAALALAALSIALLNGEASRVVPITSAYPVVTVLLAVPLLSERVTARRLAGCLLVVSGVVLISV